LRLTLADLEVAVAEAAAGAGDVPSRLAAVMEVVFTGLGSR